MSSSGDRPPCFGKIETQISVSDIFLRVDPSGNFKGAINLDQDQAYEFRYVVDGNYVDDEQADRYQWNDYAGSENAVLDI